MSTVEIRTALFAGRLVAVLIQLLRCCTESHEIIRLSEAGLLQIWE